VVRGDPALVVAAAVAAAGGAGRFGARERLDLGSDRLARAGPLAARGGSLGLGLREERLDPGLVDEVEGGAEDA
jgi:hypothetical protein